MRVLTINLDRSPERLAEFTAEAARCGLAFERLPAVDGAQLDAQTVAMVVDPDFRFQPMGRGEVAIFLSHRKAWRVAAAGSDRWMAVMEDDVRLADDILDVLAAIEEVDPDAGIVRLETTLRHVVLDQEAVRLTPGRTIHRMRSWHGGMAAYAIHRNCARDLLARSERFADPVDQWLFNPLSPVFDVARTSQLFPGAAVQASLIDASSIGAAAISTSGRRQPGKAFGLRHGVVIDSRRLAMKLLERGKRLADKLRPGRRYRFVPFIRSPKPL